MAPGFPIPPNTDYKGYHNYIDECIPPETPYLYGLHPNAEIEFLTSTSDNMFRVVFEMQPRDTGAGAAGGVSREEKVTIASSPSRRFTGELLVYQFFCPSIPSYRLGLSGFILVLNK